MDVARPLHKFSLSSLSHISRNTKQVLLFRFPFFMRNQPDSMDRLKYKCECGSTIVTQPEVRRLFVRLLVERSRRFMACGYRNRDDLKLKQSAFRKREQRTIALLVSTVPQHTVQRTGTDKLRLKPYVSNTVTTVFGCAELYRGLLAEN